MQFARNPLPLAHPFFKPVANLSNDLPNAKEIDTGQEQYKTSHSYQCEPHRLVEIRLLSDLVGETNTIPHSISICAANMESVGANRDAGIDCGARRVTIEPFLIDAIHSVLQANLLRGHKIHRVEMKLHVMSARKQ